MGSRRERLDTRCDTGNLIVVFSRRRFFELGLAAVGTAAVTSACATNAKRDAGTNRNPEDFSGRFARYQAAAG